MADRSVSTRRANLAVVAGPEADSEGALQAAEEVEEDTSVEAEVVVVEEVGVASHEVVETGDMVVDVMTTEVEAHTDQKEATTTKTEHKEEDMEIVQEVTRVAGRTVASGCLSSGHGPSPRTGGPIPMTAGLAWS